MIKGYLKALKASIKNLLFILRSGFNLFKKKTIIWMIGDSTMCYYDASFMPMTGWGMPFADYFDATITVKNKAKSGYSTQTFIQQHYWWLIVKSLRKGDYVLIQFGHNDENINEPGIYTSPEMYGKNLANFIDETKAKSAYPILITPIARRVFNTNGALLDTHHFYSKAAKEIAEIKDIPLIDLDKLSMDLLVKFGTENSRFLFNNLLPNENPNYPNGIEDDTHLNEFGARQVAQLVLQEIKSKNIALAKKIRLVYTN